MITRNEAIKKIKKEYPDVEFLMGTLCNHTYAFSGFIDGELVNGYFCVDADTGNICDGIDISSAMKSFERNGFRI